MASSKKKSKAGGIIVGPIFVFLGLSALWKNETRFDYHKAAAKTTPGASLETMVPSANHSYTGRMNEELSLPGKYIKTFTGYWIVKRAAEIYAWDRDEDSDGDVTWSRRWMSSVESNSRNRDLRQELQSGRLLPQSYEVEDLEVSSDKIEFVDSWVDVAPGPLPKTEYGDELEIAGDFLMLRKGRSDDLGDERLSFRALPVPPVATWFGRFESGKGVADIAKQETGMVDSMIQNTGVLHHLVAGERDVALRTMKRHIQRLKWIIRGIGTVVVVFGFIFLFASLVRFLYAIPFLGRIAETGAFLLALAIGIPTALATIALGFVAGNPILLLAIGVLLLVGIVFLIRNARKQRLAGEAVKQEIEADYGHALEEEEMKRLEYQEMAGLLISNEKEIGTREAAALERLATKSGIAKEEQETLLNKAREASPSDESAEAHLKNLIRFAVADAKLTPQEIRTMREAATLAGYSREEFRKLIAEVSRMPEMREAS